MTATTAATAQQRTPAESIEYALQRFGSVKINKLSDVYICHPALNNKSQRQDDESSDDESRHSWENRPKHPFEISRGGFAKACRVRRVRSSNNNNNNNNATTEPPRLVKVMKKSKFYDATQIQHLCGEIACTKSLESPHLNKRAPGDSLFHNDHKVFLVLELIGGPRPTVLTRAAHVYSMNAPSRLPELDDVIESWRDAARSYGVDPDDEEAFGDYVDDKRLVQGLAVSLGSKRPYELPVSTDLFGLIVDWRVLPDPITKIIAYGTLQGLNTLHSLSIVHRDLKPENIVIGETRTVKLKRDGESKKIVGATFYSKFDVVLIDFGLVKYMNLSRATSLPSHNDSSSLMTKHPSPGSFVADLEAQIQKQKQQEEAAGVGCGKEKVEKKQQEEDEIDPDFDLGKLNELESPATGAAAESTTTSATSSSSSEKQQLEDSSSSNNNNSYVITSTPGVGTVVYTSLELLLSLKETGYGRSKFLSTSETLPLFDIFGASACCYCCIMGRPPFRPVNPSQNKIEKFKQVEELVRKGASFKPAPNYPTPSEESVKFVSKLMSNDLRERPSAAQGLKESFLEGLCDNTILVTEVNCSNPGFEPRKGRPPMSLLNVSLGKSSSSSSSSSTSKSATSSSATSAAGGGGKQEEEAQQVLASVMGTRLDSQGFKAPADLSPTKSSGASKKGEEKEEGQKNNNNNNNNAAVVADEEENKQEKERQSEYLAQQEQLRDVMSAILEVAEKKE